MSDVSPTNIDGLIESVVQQYGINMAHGRTMTLQNDLGPFKAGTKVASVIDWVMAIYDLGQVQASNRLNALFHRENQVSCLTMKLQFPGRGQRPTPVTDGKGLVTILCKFEATTDKAGD
jgi:hypothetical protein